MKLWTFKVFISSSGRDTFQDWIGSLDADAEEKIRATINLLSVTRFWDRPHFAKLKGYRDIYEIRVKGKDKEYRPIGCKGPGPQVFTLLVGASKKMKVWTPANAKETAEKRRRLVFKDRRYLGEYKLPEKSPEE